MTVPPFAKGKLQELADEAMADSNRWFPGQAKSLAFNTLALCGEAGELANLVKKVERGSLDPSKATTRHEIAMEATDVFIYLLNIAAILGIDLERSYKLKRTENERRFGKS